MTHRGLIYRLPSSKCPVDNLCAVETNRRDDTMKLNVEEKSEPSSPLQREARERSIPMVAEMDEDTSELGSTGTSSSGPPILEKDFRKEFPNMPRKT